MGEARHAGDLAAVLAGGRGRRMGGRNKALLEVGGRAILDRQLEVLRPRVVAVAAVLAADASAAEEAPMRARGLEVVRDRRSGRGPLAGLEAALAWAVQRAPDARVLVVACDMPHLEGAVVDLVLARARDARADLAVPIAGGRPEPLLACYGARCRTLVGDALAAGRLRLVELPDAARAAGLRVEKIDEEKIRNLDPDLVSFANLNRPSDRL